MVRVKKASNTWRQRRGHNFVFVFLSFGHFLSERGTLTRLSVAYYSATVPALPREKVVFSESLCFDTTSTENEFENCSFCTGICYAGGLFPIDHPQRGVYGK